MHRLVNVSDLVNLLHLIVNEYHYAKVKVYESCPPESNGLDITLVYYITTHLITTKHGVIFFKWPSSNHLEKKIPSSHPSISHKGVFVNIF